MSVSVRPIQLSDDPFLEKIIIQVMQEYQAKAEGTILGDPVIKSLSRSFIAPRAAYFIAEENNKILGGCGIKQLDGADDSICELQRMFLLPEARGKGIGKMLMDKCLSIARSFDYTGCYLETLSNMTEAQGIYKKYGFRYLSERLGETGHSGCGVFMYKDL